MLYREFDRKALDAAYNNTEAVGQARRDQYVAGWTARSDAFRARYGGRLDLRYGTGARQRLDIFSCGAAGAPTVVYIHGGYWQANDKEPYACLGEGLLPAGFNLALVEYTLAPAARLGAIVAEIRASVAWVIEHAKAHGGDPARVFVAGHSAGGHLTAMALAHDWTEEGLPQDCIKGAVATSGVFDLDMVMKVSVQEQVKLTPEVAKLNSPFLNPPQVKCPLVVAVGSAEPKGWQQMSQDYFEFCKQHGMHVDYLVVPGANHYTMSEKLLDENNPLTQAMIKQLKI